MTNFNERTNTLLYKNISLTLYSRKGDVSCVWEVSGDKDGLLFWPIVLLTIAALLPRLDWIAQPWVTEGPKPSVCRWLSIRHLVSNWLKPSVCWLYYYLTPTFFRCSSAYLHRCISWLTARSRVNILQCLALLEKQGGTHKQSYLMDSYLLTHQYWSTNKNLHSPEYTDWISAVG